MGGKRTGAGRKPGKDWDGTGEYQKGIRRVFTLSQENFQWLRRRSKKTGMSQASIVNDALGVLRETERIKQCSEKEG